MKPFYLPTGIGLVNTPRKTEVLSIKTTPEIKLALKTIGEREHRSMANMLETLVMDYYKQKGLAFPKMPESTEAVQKPDNTKESQ